MDGRDDIEQRLQAMSRVPAGTESTAALKAVLDRIGERIMAEAVVPVAPTRRAGHRERLRVSFARRGLLLASVVGVVVVGGAAAATTILSTYSGRYASGRQVQEFGSGQFLRIGASGFCQAADQLAATIPFPAGERQAWIDWSLLTEVGTRRQITIHQLCDTNGSMAQNVDGGTGGDQTTSSLQGTLAASALCAWSDAWLRAKASGDTATASQATSEITAALQWPASEAADPHPVAGGVDRTTLGFFIPVQKAVQIDDFADVKSLFTVPRTELPGGPDYAGYCAQYMPNAASDNGTVLTRAMLSRAAENASTAANGGI